MKIKGGEGWSIEDAKGGEEKICKGLERDQVGKEKEEGEESGDSKMSGIVMLHLPQRGHKSSSMDSIINQDIDKTLVNRDATFILLNVDIEQMKLKKIRDIYLKSSLKIRKKNEVVVKHLHIPPFQCDQSNIFLVPTFIEALQYINEPMIPPSHKIQQTMSSYLKTSLLFGFIHFSPIVLPLILLKPLTLESFEFIIVYLFMHHLNQEIL